MTYCPFTDEKCINENTTCSGCSFNFLEENIEDSEDDFIDENFELDMLDIDYSIEFVNYEDYLPLTEDELPY